MAEFDRAWRLTEHSLTEPLRWRKSVRARIGADLFDDSVSDEIIDHRFAVMALCPQHTFQVLTKRTERMLEYFNGCVAPPFDLPLQKAWVTQWWRRDAVARAMYNLAEPSFADRLGHVRQLPLPNVWLGVSCERQQEADERIPHLLQTPAAVRFVSAEPLLGPINLKHIKVADHGWQDVLEGWRECKDYPGRENTLDWVIDGGESGPDARAYDITASRDLERQCRVAGVSYFRKQLGARPFERESSAWRSYIGLIPDGFGNYYVHGLKDRKGGDWSEWPEDLRKREFPSRVIATNSPQSQALPESNPASASLVSSLGLNPRVATSGEEAGAGAVLKDDRKC